MCTLDDASTDSTMNEKLLLLHGNYPDTRTKNIHSTYY